MILSEHPRIELICGDCLDFMAGCKDKQFDLALVDPPYGIGESLKKRENTISDKWKTPYKKKHNVKNWDKNKPKLIYFKQIERISKNQIIWGANHFISLNPYDSSCWIVWDKVNGDSDFADAELAWTSFNSAVRIFRYLWNGFQKAKPEDRIHPTQKPVKLYEWLLTNYAKPGDTIFDSHGGSFSSAIAAYRMGFDFTGIELDADYFNAAVKRFKEQTAQMNMFKPVEKDISKQLTIDND